MTEAGARTAVNSSALVVGGAFLYNHLISQTSVGKTKAEPVGGFVVGWGVVYIFLAVLSDADANLAGSLAILIAAGALLYNGQKVMGELSHQLKQSKKSTSPIPPSLTHPPQFAPHFQQLPQVQRPNIT